MIYCIYYDEIFILWMYDFIDFTIFIIGFVNLFRLVIIGIIGGPDHRGSSGQDYI